MRRAGFVLAFALIASDLKVAPTRTAEAQPTSASYRFVSQVVTSGGGAVVGVCSTGTLATGALGVELIGRADGTQSRTIAGVVPTWPPVVVTDLNGGVVINELAWSGSDASTADEWIELRNRTDQTVDVSGWQITYDTGTGNVLMVTIPPLKILPPRGFFLIANFTTAINPLSTTLNVLPDVVDTGVFLSNTNLKVRLYRGSFQSGPLVDTAGNGGAPLAGSTGTGTHRSMERREIPGDGTQAASWRTAVAAVNFKSGATERGTPRTANTEEIPPAAITNLTALPNGMAGPGPGSPLGRVLLTWTAPGDDCDVGTASAYFVRYATFSVSGDPELWWSRATPVTALPAPLLAGTTQTVAVDGLTSETKYFWAIRAQDDVPNVGSLDFRTQGGPTLQAREFPNGLRTPTSFVSQSVSTGIIRFSWVDNSTLEDRYLLSNCEDNATYEIPANQTVFLASVSANTQFGCNHFTDNFTNKLAAFSDKLGASGAMLVISAFSLANVPTGLMASEIMADHVRLTWSETEPAHPATRYGVERSSDNQQTWVTIATWTTNLTTTPFTDMTLVEGSTLAYRVRGFNGNQIATAPTDPVTVVVPRIAPATVTDLLAHEGNLEGSVFLAWTAPGDDGTIGTAATYLIRYSSLAAIITEPAFASATAVMPAPPAPVAGGTPQNFTVTGLDTGVTYYFALRTLDEAGNASPLSNSPGTSAAAVGSAVRVSEVAAGEPSNGDWIELTVGRAAGSLAGWTLRASTGTNSTDRLVKTFPALTPQKGDFLVVEWKANPPPDDTDAQGGKGADGVWNLYVDTGTGSAGLIATDNAITLKDAGGAIHDFMAWGNQDKTWVSAHQAAADAAVVAGQWRRLGANTLQFDCPSSRTTGTSGVDDGNAMARNETATDEGHKGDWSYKTIQTKGAANGPSTIAPGLGTAKTNSGGTILAGGTTTLLLTYAAANPNTDATRHMVTWDIPPGWSVPQSTSSTGVGFTTTTFGFTNGFSLSVIGRTIILPVGNLANGAAVTVEYRNAIVQSSSGMATFLASADDNGTNVVALLAGSPSLNVTSGGAGAPRLARPQSPSLGVPPERVVAGPNPVVGGGPANLWFYADWPQWTARVCLMNSAGEMLCEGGDDGGGGRGGADGSPTLTIQRSAGLIGRPEGRPYAMGEAPYIHRAVWNGRNVSGTPVASGVYMMMFDITNPETGESQHLIRKIVVIR